VAEYMLKYVNGFSESISYSVHGIMGLEMKGELHNHSPSCAYGILLR